MSRVKLVKYEDLSEIAKKAYDEQIEKNGYVTNMKKTLLQSFPAFQALMQWYPLRDELLKFLSPRTFIVYAYAISAENDCLLCSTFFRKAMQDLNVSLGSFELTEEELLLESFGQALVNNSKNIKEEIFDQLQKKYSEEQIVLLTAFGGLMIATNLINNVLKVDVDEQLEAYLPGGAYGK